MRRGGSKLIPIREVGGNNLIYKHEKNYCMQRKMTAHVLLCQSGPIFVNVTEIKANDSGTWKEDMKCEFWTNVGPTFQIGPPRKRHHSDLGMFLKNGKTIARDSILHNAHLEPPTGAEAFAKHSPSFLPSSALVHWVLAGQPMGKGKP